MSKAVFPACASFGPVFMTAGTCIAGIAPPSAGTLVAVAMAAAGAFMTAGALLILFRMLVALEKSSVIP